MAGAGCGLLGLVAEGLTRQGPANFDIRPFVRVPQEGPTSFFLCIGFSKELESLFGGARFWLEVESQQATASKRGQEASRRISAGGHWMPALGLSSQEQGDVGC